jgi:hypothetical protein
VSERSAGREPPPQISGKVSLVMSGLGRKMYRSLEPKTEGVMLVERSMPQVANNTPHDKTARLMSWRRLKHSGRKAR